MEIKHCACCGDSMSQQQFSENIINEGSCLNCIRKMEILPHDDLNADLEVTKIQQDGAWIDEYPYGTVVIDADVIVIKYNKAETEFTGLRPDCSLYSC